MFDFIEKQEAKTTEEKQKEKAREKKQEEELVQELIELFERHVKCFTKEEIVTILGVSKFKVIKLLNELSQIGIVKKRLNDNGELVYCSSKRE